MTPLRNSPHTQSGVNSFPLPKQNAFTLVELLVGASIFIIMALFLSQIFANSTQLLRSADNRYAAVRDARAALHRITRELSNLHTLRPGATYLVRQNFRDPGSPNQEIYFATTYRMGTAGNGDVCGVGYYCEFSNGVFTLRRTFLDSASFYTRMPAAPVVPPPPNTPLPAFHIIGSTPAIFTTPAGIKQGPPQTDSIFVPCLWDLKFNVTYNDGAGGVRQSGNTNLTLSNPDSKPLYIDVSFKTIGGSDVERIISRSIPKADYFNTASPNFQYVLLPKMREYRTRIFTGSVVKP